MPALRTFRRATLAQGVELTLGGGWRLVARVWSPSIGWVVLLELRELA